MKAGFDNLSKQIGINSKENRKEMKDTRESIQNLGSMLRQELATFKEEMGNRLETIDRRMEAQGRDIADVQERVAETEEWNADLKEVLVSSLKQQRRLQEKVTDLEGRSRRNNIRVWGVPEGTEKESVPKFIERLIREELKLGEEASLQIQHYPAEVAAKRHSYAGLNRVLKEEGIRFQSPLTALRIHWQGGVKTYGSPQEAAQAMKEKGMKVEGLIEEQPTLEQQLESAFKWRRVRDENDVAGRAREGLKRFIRK
ncbi:hypothetical protein DPEC_G00295770 [Dallia pectoralis]|uniref:Uncharacterized protein n=1 Tax=Dallia pectoralis TaxID=75939 RepID=A0ACC2FIZ7_DALPE|nr:hypothetical protein DPEC_G00295770 [Dallia pectoralis]